MGETILTLAAFVDVPDAIGDRSPPSTEGGVKRKGVGFEVAGNEPRHYLYRATSANYHIHALTAAGKECENEFWSIVGICDSCGNEIEIKHNSCGRLECPACYQVVANRMAIRTAARVFGYYRTGATRWKPRHVTVELDGKSVDELDFSKAVNRFKKLGFTGGAVAIHPYRVNKIYLKDIERIANEEGIDKYSVARMYSSDALVFSPHAHMIGYGKGVAIMKGTHKFEYRVIEVKNRQSDVEDTFRYIFGHCLTPRKPRENVVRYFGVCHPSKLSSSESGVRWKAAECHCGGEYINTDTHKPILVAEYFSEGWFVKGKKGLLVYG